MTKAIVTDIEGTTSSLSFVKDVLFPYARAQMATFVRDHQHDARVAPLIADVRHLIDGEASLDHVIRQLIQWIDEDKKITPLKAIQGLIWEYGYRAGDFRGHVYRDAERALRRWHASGIALYVYSSGSIHAQKLLFAHTEYGDLTPLFAGYFDTTTGAKTDAGSYRKIAAVTGCAPADILFLSDIEKELDAAATAGLQTCWLVRDRAPDPESAYPQVTSFADITLLLDKKAAVSG